MPFKRDRRVSAVTHTIDHLCRANPYLFIDKPKPTPVEIDRLLELRFWNVIHAIETLPKTKDPNEDGAVEAAIVIAGKMYLGQHRVLRLLELIIMNASYEIGSVIANHKDVYKNFENLILKKPFDEPPSMDIHIRAIESALFFKKRLAEVRGYKLATIWKIIPEQYLPENQYNPEPFFKNPDVVESPSYSSPIMVIKRRDS